EQDRRWVEQHVESERVKFVRRQPRRFAASFQDAGRQWHAFETGSDFLQFVLCSRPCNIDAVSAGFQVSMSAPKCLLQSFGLNGVGPRYNKEIRTHASGTSG